jgi:tight adherence protein B
VAPLTPLDPVALAALAGGLGALAAREAVLATPALARWMQAAVEPLRRAGSEGYSPSEAERRRLAVLGTLTVLGGAILLAGPGVAPALALSGPALVTWALASRRARYRRTVEHGLPQAATAVADAVAAGRSVRAALGAASASLEGPPATEMARIRAELELGLPTREALAGLQQRLRSQRIDAFAAAVLSQQLGGGDLAKLLRRFAVAAAERDRADADARAATAQARFTGLLVVAMPVGVALLAELLEPGFVAGVLADPVSASILAVAGALQLAGFAAIRRLSRVAGPDR